jgi:hypothetical protein
MGRFVSDNIEGRQILCMPEKDFFYDYTDDIQDVKPLRLQVWFSGGNKDIGFFDDVDVLVYTAEQIEKKYFKDLGIKVYENDVKIFDGYAYEVRRGLHKWSFLARFEGEYVDTDEEEYEYTPSLADEIKIKVEEMLVKAQEIGWAGDWYRGELKPDDDRYTDWSELDGSGKHTVVWNVPVALGEYKSRMRYIVRTDEVPEEAAEDADVLHAPFNVPYSWTDEKKPQLSFGGYFRNAYVDKFNKMRVWYD